MVDRSIFIPGDARLPEAGPISALDVAVRIFTARDTTLYRMNRTHAEALRAALDAVLGTQTLARDEKKVP